MGHCITKQLIARIVGGDELARHLSIPVAASERSRAGALKRAGGDESSAARRGRWSETPAGKGVVAIDSRPKITRLYELHVTS